MMTKLKTAYSFLLPLIFSIILTTTTHAGAPQYPEWSQTYVSDTGVYIYKRSSGPKHIISVYPPFPLENQTPAKWLSKRLAGSKSPEGRWKTAVKMQQDTSGFAGASRDYLTTRRGKGRVAGMAVKLDNKNVRFGAVYNITQRK